jgi:hypothetical protein
MLRDMSAEQFDYWLAFMRLRPFGHADRILAQIAMRIFNATKSEEQPVFELDDFLPVYRTEAEIRKKEEEKMLAEMGKQ